jgi:hypothetical protein
MRSRIMLSLLVATLLLAPLACEGVFGLADGSPARVDDVQVSSVSTTSVQLSWTEVDDGTGVAADYVVAYGTPTVTLPVSTESVVLVEGVTIGAQLFATVDGLERGTSYEFVIASYRGDLDSLPVFGPLSAIVDTTTEADAPGDIASLTAPVVGSTSASIQWTQTDDGTGNPSNYAVVIGTPTVNWDAAFASAIQVNGTSIGAQRIHQFTGLLPSTAYQVQVASIRGSLGASPVVGPPSEVESFTTTAAGVGATPFFSDDFDNGQRTNANGFSWGTATQATVSSERAFNGTHALRFPFGPNAANSDSHSEQRFNLGQYLSEYWVEYMLYVPSNFIHRDDRPANNKFYMTWRDTYSDVSGGTWRIGYEYEDAAIGSPNSIIRAMSSRWDYNSWESSGLSHPDNYQPLIGGTGPIAVGQWSRIRMQFRAASSRAASDGIMRMWVNDALYAEKTDGKFHNFYDTPADASLRNGYFLGWSNSGFTELTVFFIDAVKFYNTNPGW